MFGKWSIFTGRSSRAAKLSKERDYAKEADERYEKYRKEREAYQRINDARQKACDDWNGARKAEITTYQPSLSVRTNEDGQRFLCVGEQYQLPSWLIVGARIKDHGQPMHLQYASESSFGVMHGGYSLIVIQMASGREWDWHVAWCLEEIALDALNRTIAECRGLA